MTEYTPETLRTVHEPACPHSVLPYDWTDHSSMPPCECTIGEQRDAHADAWEASDEAKDRRIEALRERLFFIANQKDKAGNWAVEIAKSALAAREARQ